MLTLLLWVIILGLLAYAVRALPLDPPFKTVAYVIIVIILVLIIFDMLGAVHISLPTR